jgi:hypothetical protein
MRDLPRLLKIGLRSVARTDGSFDFFARCIRRNVKVKAVLDVHPELAGCRKVPAEAQSRISGYAACPVDDGTDARCRYPQFQCETVDAYAGGFHEVFEQNLTGMNRRCNTFL